MEGTFTIWRKGIGKNVKESQGHSGFIKIAENRIKVETCKQGSDVKNIKFDTDMGQYKSEIDKDNKDTKKAFPLSMSIVKIISAW